MNNSTIVISGTRGIPNILGGIETHCEELYPRIKKISTFNIILIRRSSYITQSNKLDKYKKIILMDIYTPKKKSFEAIIHTFLSIFYAKKIKANLIHIHGIGPGLLVPFAKLLGLKVVITNHGPDYDRQKWGKLAKFILKLGEKLSYKFADEVIVISEVIRKNLYLSYGKRKINLIYNGVNIPNKTNSTDFLKTIGVNKKYIFTLGRFVEEKGFHDLINAYNKLDNENIMLVIAGDADHETVYSKKLKNIANDSNVVLTGFIKGEKLNQLFSNTSLFVLPSYHEGLPIALLEAMSYNINILVSDIPANKEVQLHDDDYFRVGNVDALTNSLKNKLKSQKMTSYIDIVKEKYNWDDIAYQTKKIYDSI